jgi:hypothetical protein
MRLRGAVRRKLQKTYGLSDTNIAIPQEIRTKIAEGLQETFGGARWERTRSEAIAQSQPSHARAIDIDAVAARMVTRYTEAFQLRRVVNCIGNSNIAGNEKAFYQSTETRRVLTDILINHVSNQTEAELRSLGLTTKSAHMLHGLIIATSMQLYTTHANYWGALFVNPQLGSMRNRPDSAAEGRVAELGGYWRDQLLHLNANHDIFNGRTR